MSAKEELVKALVHIRQSWVEKTGGLEIFKSANVALGHDDILVVPVTRLDISDQYFVEVTFFPRALEHQPAKSITAFIPKGSCDPHRGVKESRWHVCAGIQDSGWQVTFRPETTLIKITLLSRA